MNFSQNVWKLTAKIPKGRVTTYKIIAERLGTKAYRAVGQALHVNPYWPKVPCHRVVGSDGSLTGFARGLGKKKRLLEEEGIRINGNKVADFEKVLFRF